MNGFPVGPTKSSAPPSAEGSDLAGMLSAGPIGGNSESTAKEGASGRTRESSEENGVEGREFVRVLASALQPEGAEIEGEFVDVVPLPEGEATPEQSKGGDLPLVGTGRPEQAEPPVGEQAATPKLVHSEPAVLGEARPYEFEFEMDVEGSLPLEAAVVDEPVLRTEGERPLLFGTAPGSAASGPVIDSEWSLGEPILRGSEPMSESGRAELAISRLEPDLSQVDPELRARLERVVGRMRAEFGHNVKVVEAYRTPERQEALFAQGRTTSGPVVTWTENSLHTEGLAVDVIVDGSFSPHEGYRRLANIAEQEGLRTLWPKDPGHLQLDSSKTTANQPLPESRNAQRPMVERPATAARVATVETLAAPSVVARPAEVAVPGSGPSPVAPAGGTSVSEMVAENAVAESLVAGTKLAENETTGTAGRPGTERVVAAELTAERLARNGINGEPPQVETLRSPLAPVDEAAPPERAAEVATNERSAETTPLDTRSQVAATLEASRRGGAAQEAAVVAATGGKEASLPTAGSLLVQSANVTSPESLHRISQIREMQELAYPRQLGQVTLRMMDGLGEEGRMRVRLEGGGVATSIGVRDLGQADLLRSRIGTLEQSLRLQGIEPLSVRVAALTSALDSMDTSAWLSDSGSDAEAAKNRQQEARDEQERREGRRSGGSRNETPYQDGRENHR